MGLFDFVELAFTCPKCGHSEPAEKREWQTKSLDCAMETYKPNDIVFRGPRTDRDGDIEIHASCPICHKRVVAFALVKKGRLTTVIEFPTVPTE